MSPPGRPKGEYRRAQPEGTPVSAPGQPHGRACRRGRLRGDKRKQLRLSEPASPQALIPEHVVRRAVQ
jgi:hypothetical protein